MNRIRCFLAIVILFFALMGSLYITEFVSKGDISIEGLSSVVYSQENSTTSPAVPIVTPTLQPLEGSEDKPKDNPPVISTSSPLPEVRPLASPSPVAEKSAEPEKPVTSPAVFPSPSPQALPGFENQPLPSPSPIDIEEVIKRYESKRMSQKGSAVNIGDRTIFYIYSELGPYNERQRAALISRTLNKLFNDEELIPDRFHFVEGKSGKSGNIFYRDKRLFTVTSKDASAYELNVDELADRWVTIMKLVAEETIRNKKEKLTRKGMTVGIAGLVLLFLIFALAAVTSKRVQGKLESLKGDKIKAFRIQNVDLITEEQMVQVIFSVYRVIVFIGIMIMVYFYFNYFLTYYPGTEVIRNTLYNKPLAHFQIFLNSFLAYLPKLVFIIIVILGIRYILKLNDMIFNAIKSGAIQFPGFHPEFRKVTQKILKFLIYFFALILIAPNLPGYASPAFKGLSIFTGIIVSLGSSSFVSNIIAGIMIAYYRPFAKGDRVQIGDKIGDITDMSLLVVKLRTFQDIDVSIPNSVVLSSDVSNYHSAITEKGAIKLYTTITIGYDVPGDKVKELCIKAVNATPDFLKDPPSFVLQKSLDDFYVSYEIYGYTDKPENMKQIYSDLNSNIRKFFDEDNVEIMSPHYRTLRDGNAITIPAKYLPGDYSAPPFYVSMKDEKKVNE